MEGKSGEKERARTWLIRSLNVLVALGVWYSMGVTSSIMPLFMSLAFDWLRCPPRPFSVLLFLLIAIFAGVTTCLGWETKTEMWFSGRRSIQMITLASGEWIDFTTVWYLNNKLPGASSPRFILALLEHNLGYHLIGPGDWWATFERIW